MKRPHPKDAPRTRASSRKEADRFEYKTEKYKAAFFECIDPMFSATDLRNGLEKCALVEKVQPHAKGSKAAQNNPSEGHAQQHNWQVFLHGYANPLEYEVTWSKHYKEHGKYTGVSVCFKTAPRGMELLAWEILIQLAEPNALYPEKVHAWHKRVKEHYGYVEPSIAVQDSDEDESDLEFFLRVGAEPVEEVPPTFCHPLSVDLLSEPDAPSPASAGYVTLKGWDGVAEDPTAGGPSVAEEPSISEVVLMLGREVASSGRSSRSAAEDPAMLATANVTASITGAPPGLDSRVHEGADIPARRMKPPGSRVHWSDSVEVGGSLVPIKGEARTGTADVHGSKTTSVGTMGLDFKTVYTEMLYQYKPVKLASAIAEAAATMQVEENSEGVDYSADDASDVEIQDIDVEAPAAAASSCDVPGSSRDAPAWMLRSQEERTPELLAMQALKTRGLTHVRWRGERHRCRNSTFEAVLHTVRAEVLAKVIGQMARPFDGKTWVEEMWKSSRQAIQNIRDGITKTPATLLFELPTTIFSKYERAKIKTEKDQIEALLHLVCHHKGEVVEVDNRFNEWILVSGTCPAMPLRGDKNWPKLHPQFSCYQPQTSNDGRSFRWPAPRRGGSCEFGKKVVQTNRPGQLPDWEQQKNRFYVPCVNDSGSHWLRETRGTTLGVLFAQLGDQFPASTIYYFYLSMRILVVKAQGSTPSVTWRQAMKVSIDDQDQVVKDFCRVTNLPVPAPGSTEERLLTKDASEYIAKLVLGDVRPPWLPVERPLLNAKHTWPVLRHTLLCWPEAIIHVFGNELIQTISEAVGTRGASFLGIVAQPVFVCTAQCRVSGHDGVHPCGRRAVMTPLVADSADQAPWRCDVCKNSPTATESAKRLLVLWALVKKSRTQIVMRLPGFEAVVSPPPGSWQWGSRTEGAALTDGTAVNSGPILPNTVHRVAMPNTLRWFFDDEWSAGIWTSSSLYAR